MTDALNFLLINKLSYSLKQSFLVYLVRYFINNDRLALTLVNVFKVALGAHNDASTTSPVTLFDALDTVNNSGSREIRSWNKLH